MNVFKKSLALLCAAAAAAGPLALNTPVFAEESTWVDNGTLTDKKTAEPAKDAALPNANQFRYQKDELAAFCHFGPNTFNEIEWGENYGSKHPSEIFRLKNDFDADNYIKTLKDAGFKKLIITAKHHDGFCIWDSQYTDYTCAEAAKDGKGDVLAEISAACTKYDMPMGLYLSPWDIHDPSYGYKDADGNPLPAGSADDVLDYNEYYNNQLEEILGSDKYGNNGHFVEVWMDGAKGSGANAQEYDFNRWFNTIQKNEGIEAGYDADCMLFGAESYTTVHWIGNETGYAHDNTWSKIKTNRANNTMDGNYQGSYALGWEDGNQWSVPEADARITSGWFWGNNKKTPKSMTDLGNMYFGSVGNGATFLLNIPANDKGTLDKAISDRTLEFGAAIENSFAINLAKSQGATIKANNVRGMDTAFSPAKLADNDDMTVWSTSDGTNEGQILIDLGGQKTFDCVSIEEAIQYGQRINSYKVEYKDNKGEWKVMKSGTTVGPKRLVRTTAVRSDQIRITVSTPEGKTPVLSEVGVYKVDESFELQGAAPAGMDVTDVTDGSITTTGNWTQESGAQYVNSTNKYANPGATMTVPFTGTQITMIGTEDPNHGTADIYIDDVKVETINASKSPRQTSQKIFVSDTLAPGNHTLRVETKTKATGIEAFYIINNDNKGMVGIENARYTMNENETMEIKLVRVGGTAPIDVTFSPNPGSAIQDDFNTELIHNVHFAEGETEKTVTVETRRNTNKTGNRFFSGELTCADEDVILGYNVNARIDIIDEEGIDHGYSTTNPFVFPSEMDTTEVMQADLGILSDTVLESDGQWNMRVDEADWASNGKFVNCFHKDDTLTIPYTAKKAGTYSVKVFYRSGDPANSLKWSEPNGKIAEGTVVAGDSSPTTTRSVTFDLVINEPGAGKLVFTGPEKKSPLLDCFEITPKELEERKVKLTVTTNEFGTASLTGENTVDAGDIEIDLLPNPGYKATEILVNGESVEITDPLILHDVTEDTTVQITYSFDKYTEENPYRFPKPGTSATLEAETFELHNTGTNEDWPLQISSASWASGGKFVNACDHNDSISLPYYAEAAGDYEFVLTFRSGDSKNSIEWSEASGKITAGSVTAGADDSASTTHTANFTMHVEKAGAGVLTIAAGPNKAPQMDKFDITAPDPVDPVELNKSLLSFLIDTVAASTHNFGDTAAALAASLNSARTAHDEAATQKEIDDATDALHNTWLNSRIVPSEDLLAELAEEVRK